jgi:hypothetical protein
VYAVSCYEFTTKSGAVVEIDMQDAPRIGDTMEWHGEKLTRIASRIQPKISTFQPFRSMQLSHGWPYAKKWEKNPDGSKGAPIFTSEAEVKECMQAGASEGEATSWKTN